MATGQHMTKESMEKLARRELVLRLLGGMVRFYAARIFCREQVTREEILFRIKHHWRFLDSERLDPQALSWNLDPKAA
jgi:hypothetical protein